VLLELFSSGRRKRQVCKPIVLKDLQTKLPEAFTMETKDSLR
jgi:hypothetical protein